MISFSSSHLRLDMLDPQQVFFVVAAINESTSHGNGTIGTSKSLKTNHPAIRVPLRQLGGCLEHPMEVSG